MHPMHAYYHYTTARQMLCQYNAFHVRLEAMATRPQSFENPEVQPIIPPQERIGPSAPRQAEGKIISSGPLGSSLNKAVHHEYIPPGEEWVKDLLRRLPSWGQTMVAEFLKTLPPEKVQNAAKMLTELTEGVKNSPEPKTEIRHIIEQVKASLEEDQDRVN